MMLWTLLGGAAVPVDTISYKMRLFPLRFYAAFFLLLWPKRCFFGKKEPSKHQGCFNDLIMRSTTLAGSMICVLSLMTC